MDIVIRAARLSDLEVLLDLYTALDIGPEPRLSMPVAQARFLDLTANPGHRIYVATDGERIVGTFALIMVGGLAHSARPSFIVEDVVVAPGMRGRGIGRLMMVFARQECASAQAYKLVLSSHLQRDAAHQFYEGLGFRKHGYSFLVEGDDDGAT